MRQTHASLLATFPCLCLLAGTGSSQCELPTPVPPDLAGGSNLGQSLAATPSHLVAGAPTTGGTNAGAVFTFERDGDTWNPTGSLVPPDIAAEDRFGVSIAISDNSFVAGSFLDNVGPHDDAGSADVYDWAGTWSHSQKLTALDASPNARFGSACAIDGQTIVIGAPEDSTLGSRAGASYVFSRIGGTWLQHSKLLASDGNGDDYFGTSVAIEGNRIVVGAPGRVAAYIFEFDGFVWSQTAKLPVTLPSTADFAATLDLDGQRVAIGAPRADLATSDGGACYVATYANGSWSIEALPLPSGLINLERLGSSVSLSGDLLAVGAPGESGTNPPITGSAYLYEYSAENWNLAEHLEPSGANLDDRFGSSLCVAEDFVLCGADQNDEAGPGAGAVNVWKLANCPTLAVDTSVISTAAGGAQLLHLDSGPTKAGHLFFLLGTVMGTQPGIQLGEHDLPLNAGPYFLYSLKFPNQPPLFNSFGFLSPGGSAEAMFSLPSGTFQDFAGIDVHHSYAVLDPVTLAVVETSNAAVAHLTK